MATRDLLRVTHIRVVNLFGRYTYEVPLRTNDRVTIIHGPNGVGKTVLLRLVAASLSGNFPELVKVPFQTFEVTLSDGAVLGFRRAAAAVDQSGDEDFVGTCYLRRLAKIWPRSSLTQTRSTSDVWHPASKKKCRGCRALTGTGFLIAVLKNCLRAQSFFRATQNTFQEN